MFDIGFFELLVIAVIGLLVLGPERLPHAIRMTSAWLGKFRRAALVAREEIEREVNAFEVQQRLKTQLQDSGLEDVHQSLTDAKQQFEQGLSNDEATNHNIQQPSTNTTKPND